ncbi:MAG: Holliday junction branch migration protein RuvA [Gammaproteobacteria bacterium]|nr:Holliday junction branch migration protein RuvA [Gammaproteobacteria bacterium]MCP4880538.1 Holliday junction branch migration protein RuvA [Gammaproteobacteria bacterium]MDP6165808.1 Holliday junction branch migration protein RuvA [Gammaproteobacteria bacterium]
MIGRLQGLIILKQPDQILVDVNGVGYEVEISFNSYCQLPETNQSACVHTHLIVRDDAHLLFGFASLDERALFRLLIKINGVGPKLALAILSGMEAPALATCVQNQDVATMVKIPGVGKKTAERLVMELRDKMGAWQGDSRPAGTVPVVSPMTATASAQEEAESALINLGYKPVQATKAVAAAVNERPDGASADLIRLALKGML